MVNAVNEAESVSFRASITSYLFCLPVCFMSPKGNVSSLRAGSMPRGVESRLIVLSTEFAHNIIELMNSQMKSASRLDILEVYVPDIFL